MKTIFLLRHAKSSWKDKSIPDLDRPLAKRGRRAAAAMGRHLLQRRIIPDQVLCSPAQRARETLDRVEEHLAAAVPVRYEKAIYMADAAALLRRLGRLSDSLASVMLIGHNPALETLAQMLVACADEAPRQQFGSKFPTGALAVLTTEAARWRDVRRGCARLTAFIRPKDLPCD